MKKFSLYIFFLLLFSFFLQEKLFSGTFPTVTPEMASYQLYYVWDTRDRNTYVQVYNTSSSPVNIHLQFFNATGITVAGCRESNLFDTLTPFDSHVYDFSGLRNNYNDELVLAAPEGEHGFAVITVVENFGCGGENLSVNNPVLIGNLRIVDNNGFEYRANAAPYPVNDETDLSSDYTLNFNKHDSTSFSDFMPITVNDSGAGINHCGLGVNPEGANAIFTPIEADDNELLCSCLPLALSSCTIEPIPFLLRGHYFGINPAHPSSKDDAPEICGCIYEDGFLNLIPSVSTPSNADFFTAFIGLNNGNNRGSMELVRPLK